MQDLWDNSDPRVWRRALDSYESVTAGQGVESLPDLDSWYRIDLPTSIASREPPFIDHDELARLTKWKMARGVWRGRNLSLVKSNDPQVVIDTSRTALATIPDPKRPISALAKLSGVGPATASAVAAAAAPDLYPFFDEVAADQVPGLGKVAYTLKYYAEYAEAIRERASQLGAPWTAAMVEQALWANAGGKRGDAARPT